MQQVRKSKIDKFWMKYIFVCESVRVETKMYEWDKVVSSSIAHSSLSQRSESNPCCARVCVYISWRNIYVFQFQLLPTYPSRMFFSPRCCLYACVRVTNFQDTIDTSQGKAYAKNRTSQCNLRTTRASLITNCLFSLQMMKKQFTFPRTFFFRIFGRLWNF